MSLKRYFKAVFKVARRSFQISPAAALMRLGDSFFQALLPVATTYFAAQTTTALTQAYAGSAGAGDKALLYVGITVGLGVVMLVWQAISDYVSQKTRYIIDAAIEDEMIMKFSQLPFYMYDDKDVVDLYEKAKRFSGYFAYIFETIGQMLKSFIGVIGSMVALIVVSPWLSLAMALAVMPGAYIQLRLARQQMEHWEGNITNRRRRYNINYTLQETRYIAEMRVYGVVKYLVGVHAKLRDADDRGRVELELKTGWRSLAASIFEAVVELAAMVWIVLQIIAKEQPVGQFVYVQLLVSRSLTDARSLATQLGRIDEDLANVVDYQAFMEIKSGNQQASNVLPETAHNISINQVSFAYPKTETEVLKDVSINIGAGERVAIVGENGAGKSTLIKLIMGLYTPTKGSVLVDGWDVNQLDLAKWHSKIAMLSQEFAIYDFATMKENITLGDTTKPVDEGRLMTAVRESEFDGVVAKLKHGLNTFTQRWMAHERDDSTATDLSGGQRQRLALARNFYRDSPIMILDEPTSAIDALAEARIFKRIFEKKNKTIIIVSHRVTTIQKADRVYMMEDGKVVESGTHQELVDRRGKYYAMFESQIN